MKYILNIALFISCFCVDLYLNANVNQLSDQEATARYTQCQDDYELAQALHLIQCEEQYQRASQDLKHSHEAAPRLYIRFAPDVIRKQQRIDERKSLKFIIKALNGELLSNKAALNFPEMEPHDIEYLKIAIGLLEKQIWFAEKQRDYLDREI